MVTLKEYFEDYKKKVFTSQAQLANLKLYEHLFFGGAAAYHSIMCELSETCQEEDKFIAAIEGLQKEIRDAGFVDLPGLEEE